MKQEDLKNITLIKNGFEVSVIKDDTVLTFDLRDDKQLHEYLKLGSEWYLTNVLDDEELYKYIIF